MLTSSPFREQTGRCHRHIRALFRTFRTPYRRGVFHHTKVGTSASLFRTLFKGEEGLVGSYSRACDTLTLALLHREQALTGLLTLKRGALKSDTELLIFSFTLFLPLLPKLFPFVSPSSHAHSIKRGRGEKRFKKEFPAPPPKKQENAAPGKIEVQLPNHASIVWYVENNQSG